MKCDNCKSTIKQEDVFCGNCGEKNTVPQVTEGVATRPKVKVAAPQKPPANKRKPAATRKFEQSSAPMPAKSSARRRLRAFFSGGTVLTLMGLAGFLVDLNTPGGEGGIVFMVLGIIALVALIITTIMKRVSLGSCLLSLAGAVFGVLVVGMLSATLDPSDFGIGIIFALVLAVFAIPAILFRKG